MTKSKPSNFFHGRKQDAVYRDSQDPFEAYNVFADALPDTLTREKLIKELTLYPTTVIGSNAERDVRMRAVLRVKAFVDLLTDHLRIYDRTDGLLRSGYFGRNPIEKESIKQLHCMYPDIDLKKIEEMESLPFDMSGGFLLTGLSGTGKSTGLKNILLRYPQQIAHKEYHGHKFMCNQLVWLYLQCPPNGAIRDLVVQAFEILVQLTGNTKLRKCYAKDNLSASVLAARLIIVIKAMGLGLLVVDEIQNLLPQKDRVKLSNKSLSGICFAPRLIKFLLFLSNDGQIPMVFSGTPEATLLMRAQMAVARRAGESTTLTMQRFKDDATWRDFLENLFRYQFVVNKVAILDGENEDLITTLYYCSQGIIHCAVRLFAFAQWEAMYRQNEKITPEIICYVYDNYMETLKPWLSFIRAGREHELSSIDGELPDLLLDEFLDSKKIDVKKTKSTKPSSSKKDKSPAAKREEKNRLASATYQQLKKEGLLAGSS